MLCGLADAVDALVELGVPVERVLLIGGAARNRAVVDIAPRLFARPVLVAEPGEYVADGAARQAAATWLGGIDWPEASGRWVEGEPTPHVRAAYAELRDATAP
jgi:xylulokinase